MDIIKKIETLLNAIENEDENLDKLAEAMEYYCGTHDKCEWYKHAIYLAVADQFTHHEDEQDPEHIEKLIKLLS